MKYFFVLLSVLTINAASGAALRVAYAESEHISADSDTVFRKSSVSIGVNYGSDFQFFGRTGPITYPYESTDAIYNFKTGIFLYASTVKVLGYDPFFDEVDVGGGYLFHYSKKLTGTVSYSRFIFNKDAAAVIKSASSNDIDYKTAYNWKFATSSVTFDYLFGTQNDYFVTFSTSKYIETSWSIFDDKDYLSFNPTISAILGTQNFVQRYSRDNPTKIALEYVGTGDHDGDGRPPGPPPYDNGRFNALNYSIKIPIAYNRPHYTFEASWKYSIPVNVEGALKNHHEVFFNLTFYYLFF